MSRRPDAAGPSTGASVPGDLLAPVRDAIAAFEGEGPGDPAAAAAALVRVTREALAALAGVSEGGPGDGAIRETAAGDRRAGRALVHRILEAAATRKVRLALASTPFAEEWIDLVVDAAVASDYTVGDLFFSRARALGDRTLFLLPPSRPEGRISWAEAEERVIRTARALVAWRDRKAIGADAGPVALLGDNSPEIALFDLACLSVGVPVVPVPANSPPEQIAWILRHCGARFLFVGGERLADLAESAIESLGDTLRPHWLVEGRSARGAVRPLEEFLAMGMPVGPERVREEVERVRSSDVATTMYTSGTTGDPKGVPFTQANLVTKRFARAAAWPDLGEGDVFLCYLPLYHTFGRWLEMLGCVFWSAVYAFVEDVSVESLLYSFQRARPTTFISVPKKWLQVEEAAAARVPPDPDGARDERAVARELVRVTGGRLKRGLSAAGYLPADVFRRFHDAGIELHSGFGMTEATGGITMTPAGDYRDDSIGLALPAIELKVADDGELLIRGPYVTPPAAGDPPRDDEWFATGDIVVAERDGHLRIVDRKKEIFKNVQGETVSPRRIESLFTDFDVVERVILVGDGRPYCTLLVVPSAELREEFAGSATAAPGPDPDAPATLDSPELHDLFAPVVSTVNRFLAPFERILDFAILARDLDADLGELTAKGTPRRKIVAERCREIIEPMYSREAVELTVGDLRVRIPLWFLRQVGIPSNEVRVVGSAVELGGSARRLPIRRVEGETGVIVGDLQYESGGAVLRLGEILGRAELWLGNQAAREFAGPGIEHWWRRGRRFEAETRLTSRRPGALAEAPPLPAGDGPLEVDTLHEITRHLSLADPEARRAAVETLRESLTGERPEIDALVHEVLRSGLGDRNIRAWCLRAMIPVATPVELDAALTACFPDPSFLSDDEVEIAGSAPLRGDQLGFLLRRVREMAHRERGLGPDLRRLLRLLGEQAIRHRATHLRVRSLLAVLLAEKRDASFRTEVDARLERLIAGFRGSLPPVTLAPGVSREEAVAFAGEVGTGQRARILEALETTKLLPEAMALLGAVAPEAPVALRRQSVRITWLGRGRGRSVFLLEWSPAGLDRTPPRFECVLKLNDDLTWDEIREEHRLLVRARRGVTGRPVVKTQGGGYEAQGLWTEEFIPGSTLDALVESLIDEGEDGGRLPDLWQFLVSASAGLVVDFWNRTGREVTIAEPRPEKVVLPGHDWQVGGRLVSIAERVPADRLTDVLLSVHQGIVRRLRKRFPVAHLEPAWRLLFSGALEVLGEAEGLALLEREAAWRHHPTGIGPAALRFVSSVKRRGFLPVHIRLAARRYRRWTQLNPSATLEARAATLDQLAAAYGLSELDVKRPGSRLQLYRHTVFRGAGVALTRAFDAIIADTLATAEAPAADAAEPAHGRWHDDLAALRERFELGDDHEFFLARILYPHVDPGVRAVLVREEGSDGGFATGIEVGFVDREGEEYRIHPPRTPNEVSALSRVFRAERFRRVPVAGRDELLVVMDERRRVCGGVIFHRPSETYVHLEWLVVSRHRRGRGLGGALLGEFLARMKAQGVDVVSVGFFRPRFFAKFGFDVDPRYAGLVRFLRAEAGSPAVDPAVDPGPDSGPGSGPGPGPDAGSAPEPDNR